MRNSIILWLLEFFGLSGLVLILAYVKWIKVGLGAVVAVVGAFFPQVRQPRKKSPPQAPETGSVKFSWQDVSVAARGTLRALVVIAGIIIIVGGIVEGVSERQADEQKAKARAEESERQLRERIQALTPEQRQTLRTRILADKLIYSGTVPPTESDALKTIEQYLNESALNKPQPK